MKKRSRLAELATGTVKQALAAGATDAECTIAEGEEFSANIRMREVESLKEAGSRGAGHGERVKTAGRGARKVGE